MVAPGLARSFAIRRACLLSCTGFAGTWGATVADGGAALRFLEGDLLALVDNAAVVERLREVEVAGALLLIKEEAGTLVLRWEVLAVMRISWFIHHDHRGGEPVTLYVFNTSSHLYMGDLHQARLL